MQCPVCEAGMLIPLRVTQTDRKGKICDACESLWLDDEIIGIHTPHTLSSLQATDGREYVIKHNSDKSQEYDSVKRNTD